MSLQNHKSQGLGCCKDFISHVMFYDGKGLNERVSLLEHTSYLSHMIFFVNHGTRCIEIFGYP